MEQNAPTRDIVLPLYFLVYVLATGVMFVFLPRLIGVMPWDFVWVFLLVTPSVAGFLLSRGVRAGRFSGWAIAVFVVCTVVLGFGYLWVGYQIAAAV